MSATRVEVFEHETLRVGDALRTPSGERATFTARHFQDLVRFNDASGHKYFEVGHQRITLTQYVGYVEVGDLAIEILPKVDRSRDAQGRAAAWRHGLIEMLQVVAGMRLEIPSIASQRMGRSSLLDMLALRFVDEVQRLLRDGLAKGYRTEELNGAVFRGRLLVAHHLRENLVRADRFCVLCQTYDRDIVINQVLGTALHVLDRLALSPEVTCAVAMCRAAFPDLMLIQPRPQLFARIQLGRATTRYRDALVLARTLLEHAAPRLRSGPVPVFALLFDMNVLWERYVAALFRRAAMPALEISTQESRPFWKLATRPARRLRPDVLVRLRSNHEVALIADTKWKLLREGIPNDEDLRQMFVYNEVFGANRAVLIYPSVAEPSLAEGRYLLRSHSCGTLQLGLFDGAEWSGKWLQQQLELLLSGIESDNSKSDAR